MRADEEGLSLQNRIHKIPDWKYMGSIPRFYNGVYQGEPRTMMVSLDWKL